MRNVSRTPVSITTEPLESRRVFSAPGTGWQLLWADEFNGTALNQANWDVHTGARRHATNTPSAVAVANGNLAITTYTDAGKHYTGFVGSRNDFRATYGYWEARIKYNDAPGMWSAFWMQSPTMGNPIGDVAKAGTEIDISEHRVRDASGADISNKSVSNLHWDGYGASHKSVGSGLVGSPASSTSLQGNYHNYAVEWGPGGYKFYIDDRQVWSTTQAVSRRSEFIYLTSEVQDNSWAGKIPTGGYGPLASSSTKMLVDWVRVWQKPVSDITSRTVSKGVAVAPIPFTVTQRDGIETKLTVTSSNTALLPLSGITITGTGADRTLQLKPTARMVGSSTVTIKAENGTVVGSDTFTLNVRTGSLQNAGFEDSSTGSPWRGYGGAKLTTTGVKTGSKAAKISGYGGWEQVITGLRPNTTYVLGGWARVTRNGTPARIGVKFYGGDQRTVTFTTTTYTKGSVTFTTGTTNTQATIFVFKPTNLDDGYFDDIFLQPA